MARKAFGTFTDTYYQVETTWYNSGKSPAEQGEEYGTYYAAGYTMTDNPGSDYKKLACIRRADIFDKRRGGQHGENLRFDVFEDAKVVAAFITEHCHTTAGYAGREEWRKHYRGPLKTRVVLVINTEHRELMP